VSRPIVFVDTETTCLGPQAHPWEIALIRRDGDGPDNEALRTVVYDPDELPAGTSREALQIGGWLERGTGDWMYEKFADSLDCYASKDEQRLAGSLSYALRGQPTLVGVGVHFDAAVLSAMFQRHDLEPEPWHYAIVDLKAVTWGWIRGVRAAAPGDWPGTDDAAELPMSSEVLSRAVGVEPPTGDERHTALGDARWAARWFDALTGVAS
jgi:hypothetical protein